MFNKNKTFSRIPRTVSSSPASTGALGAIRVQKPLSRMPASRALAAARTAGGANANDVANAAARCTSRCARLSPRRAWRTHPYRDSQVIFYGHDLPSEFLGRRR